MAEIEDETGLERESNLGYDIDEASDASIPDTLNINDKKALLRWKFREGGHRIPLYIPKVPHIDETTIPVHLLRDEGEMLSLCEKIARDARAAQGEYVYAKQRADLLQQEVDLLKWHIASDAKVLAMKKSKVNHDEQMNLTLTKRLRELEERNISLEKTVESMDREANRCDAEAAKAETELQEKQAETEEWLARRGDFIADTALERRRANHERNLRLRQWRKLEKACNTDKALHTKLDVLKRWDTAVFEMSKNATEYLAKRYEFAGSTIEKARQRLSDPAVQPTANEILEDFVSSARTKASRSVEEL